MANTPTVQLDTNSLDTAGISVATSPFSATDARAGSVYDTAVWAASAPVWLHPVSASQWLMVSARRWNTATPVGGTPGAYSAYSVDATPSWMLISPMTGSSSSVPGQLVNIPMNVAGTGVTLIGGASRPPNLLFLLSAATVGGTPTAVLQRFHLGQNGSMAIANEDVLPTPVNGVVFDKGLQYDSPNLVVYGTDASHQLYKVTKPWAHVGFNTSTTVTIPKRTAPSSVGNPQGWQYFTGTGYSADPTELTPLTDANGTTLTTVGPMSFGSWRNQNFMTTVGVSGSTYSGHFFLSRSGLPWTALDSPVALGSSADGSYLGGGIQLMAQLQANPAASAMAAPGVVSGVPYVTWTKVSTGGHDTLNTAWNILPVKA